VEELSSIANAEENGYQGRISPDIRDHQDAPFFPHFCNVKKCKIFFIKILIRKFFTIVIRK